MKEEGRSITLTRRDMEAVIRRAAELEARDGGQTPELSEEDLVRIAGEVGLSEPSVRRALAEYRALAPGGGFLAERGALARMCGPRLIRATRTVDRPADELREAIESHFLANESLRLVRRTHQASLWEPDRGVVASLLRSVDLLGRGYELAKKGQAIELRVVSLDEGTSQVTLTKDIGKERSGWFWGQGMAVGAALSAVAGVLITGSPQIPDLFALGAPALFAPSLALARAGYGRTMEKMRLVLEGLLDRLEHGEPLAPPRPSWRDLLK